MAKISPCFKWTFIFFNSLFAIFGVIVFILGLILHQHIEEVNSLYAVITLYVIGSVIFIVAVLGAFAAYKENKCALIVFFVVMCLATVGMLRAGIPVANKHKEFISVFTDYLRQELPLTKDMESTFNPIQTHILGGLMSLVMIIRVITPVNTEILPSLALSYQPPKYSEVVNY